MKELRISWQGGVWRIAFAFYPRRSAVLLVGGDKAGVDQRRFYNKLIATADKRFDAHLTMLKAATVSRKEKERQHGKKS